MNKGDFNLTAIECVGPIGYRILLGICVVKTKSVISLNYAVQYIPGETDTLVTPVFDTGALGSEVSAKAIISIPTNFIISDTDIPGNLKSPLLNYFCKFWSIPSKESE